MPVLTTPVQQHHGRIGRIAVRISRQRHIARRDGQPDGLLVLTALTHIYTSTASQPMDSRRCRSVWAGLSTVGWDWPVIVGFCEDPVGVVVGVDAVVADIEVGWRYPFDGAGTADAYLPSVLGESV